MLRFSPCKGSLARYVMIALILVAVAGCGEKASNETPAADSSPVPGAEVLTVMAKADGVDGTPDKVVSTCVMCMLRMDGKAEHAATYGEYTFHPCSDHCRKSFEEDPAQALLSLKIPETPK